MIDTEQITLKNSEKIALISNFSTMLSAGISILEMVNSLLEDARGNQKKILEVIRDDLTQGKHLHASFAKFPLVFNQVTVSVLRAAEEAGTLDVTLKDLRENLKIETEFTDKVRSALIYPVVIVIVFLSVLLLILIVVIPRIATVFLRLRMDLPLPTRVLIFVSNLLLQYTIPSLAVIAASLLFVVYLFRKQKKHLYNLLSCLPFISKLVREIDLTQFARSLSLLLAAGIPINHALVLAKDVVIKREMSQIIDHCHEVVLSGKKLSEGLKDGKNVVPSIVIKITEAGERSGTLERSMQEISEYLGYQVSKTLQTVTTLLEPILMVVVGIFVGAMMLSIISPIYNLIGQVGGR